MSDRTAVAAVMDRPMATAAEARRFAAWLRDELAARDMTMTDLARRMDVTSELVSNWTRGHRRPGWESCVEIANGLDLPVEVVPVAARDREADPEDTQADEARLLALGRQPPVEVRMKVM